MPNGFELAPVTTKRGNVIVSLNGGGGVLLTVPVVPVELSPEQSEDVAEELLAAARASRAAQGRAG